MQSKSIHSMGSRRRRRRTRTSPAFARVVWPLTVVIVGVVTIILFRGIGTLVAYIFNRRTSREITQLNGLKDFPNLVMDLWPAHQHHETKFMKSCLGKDCLPSEDGGYLILRPPGELGKIFEEFVMNYFQMSKTETTAITIVTFFKSFLPEIPSNIIRPAILPLTLSAIDASLETTGDDFPAKNISVTDIIWVMRKLAWWHCYIDAFVFDKQQVLTLSFDRMLAYPEEAEKQLAAFLSLSHENQNRLHVPMEDLTKRAFHRIDQVHDVIMQMVDANVLEGEAKKLDDDIQNGFCDKSFYGEPDSRVTEIMDRFLMHYRPPFERKLCQKYPTSRICIDFMANYKEPIGLDDDKQ